MYKVKKYSILGNYNVICKTGLHTVYCNDIVPSDEIKMF